MEYSLDLDEQYYLIQKNYSYSFLNKSAKKVCKTGSEI